MLRALGAVVLGGALKVAAECQPGDAICRDQELPSNSLLQRDKRALGKELAEDQHMAGVETAEQARVRITKELNSDNFTISLGNCDPQRGHGDKSCCFDRRVGCTNPPNPFKSETGCPLGALCSAPLNVNPFAPPAYGYCQCQGGSVCAKGGESCGLQMPTFPKFPSPFGETEEKPKEATAPVAAIESKAELTQDQRTDRTTTESVEEARVRIAKELNSENFTISLGGCDPIRGAGDKSCCFARGITCTNPPNPFQADTGCPLGALCTAPLNVNPFAGPSYGYCQCQAGSPCENGQSCGFPSFPSPFGETENKPKAEAALTQGSEKEHKKTDLTTESVAEARVRIAKELNSNNFSITVGGCDPVRGAGDASCCFARGISCTNPPNPFQPETSCPLGALCTAPLNVNPFAGPSYGYCQCQAGSPCQSGQSCGLPSFPSPFGETGETTAGHKTKAVPTALAQTATAERSVAAQETVKTSAGCGPGTSDLSCCMVRGPTCTNPPNPLDMSTFCPEGAVCTAGFNVNPFAGPQYGYCQCQLGAHCAQDGNSCGGGASVFGDDPFDKCDDAQGAPPTACCPVRHTCTNPPQLMNLTATSCALGQACDAEPSFGDSIMYGTCKCIAGRCGADGQCQM